MPHFCPQNSPFVAVAGVLLTAFACVTARHKNRAKPYRLALLLTRLNPNLLGLDDKFFH